MREKENENHKKDLKKIMKTKEDLDKRIEQLMQENS
jgi:flagellar biosynthesis chaperone FliJ